MADDRLAAFLEAIMPDEEARKTPPREEWFKGTPTDTHASDCNES
jgi:hypothetical protein